MPHRLPLIPSVLFMSPHYYFTLNVCRVAPFMTKLLLALVKQHQHKTFISLFPPPSSTPLNSNSTN